MLKKKTKKSILKRSFVYLKNNFKIKLLRSSKNHLLINKNKFFKNYLRGRFFLNNFKKIKQILY
ncbi:hypothetical protein [Candidatus Nasuia deltocephalinicola]|uniref:hypothetical protein n=1 Tax=Candidatus Nasuia deltocephalincola TaxID=1160784 RepID=UPI00216B6560|nr:hypothetical protein [Candidatus Nasuia deltocephalinicola]